MVKINKIYTRTGDDGGTHLVGGSRVKKNSLRVSSYGEIDELNSWIGWARTEALESQSQVLAEQLQEIQQELFDLGSELATPPGGEYPGMVRISAKQSERLESWIDQAIEGLPELRSFVLPGGNALNSVLHVARAVCRRAERAVITLSESEVVTEEVRIYLNRLSDLLFAMARRASFDVGAKEFLWQPGKRP